jgi:hypothetical protein
MLAAAALGLAACGSQSSHLVDAPRLPRAVAASLAARSDALAAALRRNDACTAQSEARALERQARAAVSAGRVPVVYRARLLEAVGRLAGRVPRCLPPPPPPPSPPASPAAAPVRPEPDHRDAHPHPRHHHPKPKPKPRPKPKGKHGKGDDH